LVYLYSPHAVCNFTKTVKVTKTFVIDQFVKKKRFCVTLSKKSASVFGHYNISNMMKLPASHFHEPLWN